MNSDDYSVKKRLIIGVILGDYVIFNYMNFSLDDFYKANTQCARGFYSLDYPDQYTNFFINHMIFLNQRFGFKYSKFKESIKKIKKIDPVYISKTFVIDDDMIHVKDAHTLHDVFLHMENRSEMNILENIICRMMNF